MSNTVTLVGIPQMLADVLRAALEESPDLVIDPGPRARGELAEAAGYDALVLVDEQATTATIVTTTEALTKALDGEEPQLVEQSPALGTEDELAELFGDLYERTVFGSSKLIDGTRARSRRRTASCTTP